MNNDATPSETARLALAREMTLVDTAIAMVADGHASRMQLGGLAFGDALLDHARRLAAGQLVRVTPLWSVGEEGIALTFERMDARFRADRG